MDIYAQNILDRYKEPHYKDKEFSAEITHKEANHSCGDVIETSITPKEAYGFSGQGCAISMASADMLGDLTEDMDENEILKIAKADVFEMLGIDISLRRSKCALLALLALQNGILEKRGEKLKTWTDYHI